MRMEASPSPVYGAALLMRFGSDPIRGSNPRSSAETVNYGRQASPPSPLSAVSSRGDDPPDPPMSAPPTKAGGRCLFGGLTPAFPSSWPPVDAFAVAYAFGYGNDGRTAHSQLVTAPVARIVIQLDQEPPVFRVVDPEPTLTVLGRQAFEPLADSDSDLNRSSRSSRSARSSVSSAWGCSRRTRLYSSCSSIKRNRRSPVLGSKTRTPMFTHSSRTRFGV